MVSETLTSAARRKGRVLDAKPGDEPEPVGVNVDLESLAGRRADRGAERRLRLAALQDVPLYSTLQVF